MNIYLESMRKIIREGKNREDRTGVGTRAIFGHQMRFDLSQGFPAVTTKKLAWKACVSELLWFIEGSTDERRLAEILHGTRDPEKKTIWSANAESHGQTDLGPVYGKQWRRWETGSKHWKTSSEYDDVVIDQLQDLIQEIKTNPTSRRLILTAWNPGELDIMALPPCHCFVQFFVEEGRLSCQLYQRSCDMFLGVPFNIASYSLLTHMIAQVCDLDVGEFIWTGGDCHIYLNHLDQVNEQLDRAPRQLPTLWLNPDVKSIDKFTMSDVIIQNYNPMDSIKADMAV
jgi:thymidylate synthase